VEPEFIVPQDGVEKQDCELTAGKRWLTGAGKRYVTLNLTLLGDDLYCHQPFCDLSLKEGYHFLFTCKSSSHKYLYEWIETAEVGEDIVEVVERRWTGKERRIWRYRYMNHVPLRDGEDSLWVNWCELCILDEAGKVMQRFAYVTDHKITDTNITALIALGRSRWKIENEHNNTLKTKGYNLEHNFGHGRQHLSNLLLTFNLLAYLFHTILELFDERYVLLRKTLKRRQTFFEDVRTLTRYLCFDDWGHLPRFMLQGLKLPDPGG
jgi:hypothetical protein